MRGGTTEDILNQIDEAIEDWSVGPDAMRLGAPPGAGLTSTPRPPLRRPSPAVGVAMVRIRVAMEDFARQMAKVAEAISNIGGLAALRRMAGPPVHDEHHPRPLAIDGHAYHQRRRNRRKR